jgi:hypothetical protein
MNTIALKKLLNSLLEIKSLIDDKTNTGASKKLDEVIVFVQDCIRDDQCDRKQYGKALTMVGKFLDKLPCIEAIIRNLNS